LRDDAPVAVVSCSRFAIQLLEDIALGDIGLDAVVRKKNGCLPTAGGLLAGRGGVLAAFELTVISVSVATVALMALWLSIFEESPV